MKMAHKLIGIIHSKLIYSQRMGRLAEILNDFIRNSCNEILDVGCGDGKIDLFLMKCRNDLNIIGIDVLVREKTYIHVTEYDGTNIPLNDNSVDTLMMIDVLHHTKNPADIIKEAVRVANKNIIIKDHIKTGIISYIKLRFMDYIGNAHYGVDLPYNYLTLKEWKTLFRQNGLTIDKYITNLNLYKGFGHLLFDKNLHFVVRLNVPLRESND